MYLHFRGVSMKKPWHLIGGGKYRGWVMHVGCSPQMRILRCIEAGIKL